MIAAVGKQVDPSKIDSREQIIGNITDAGENAFLKSEERIDLDESE